MKASPLFDGKTLEGWDGDAQYWSVDPDKGWITGKNATPVPSSTNLFTEKSYREFRLLFGVKKLVFDFTDQPEMLQASPIGLQLHANRSPRSSASGGCG